ncbi:MAG: sigma-70 family RNA polymerase sigma factor [Candidatus Limnocylindrales bacterium]
MAIDDATLVRAVAAGSEDALATLYDRHAGAVFGAALRLVADRQLAEEVAQETFLVMWNRAESFDPAMGSLAAWLHTIARNRAIDRLRAVARRPRLVSAASVRPDAETEAAALERIAAGDGIGGSGSISASGGIHGPEANLLAAELRATIRDALATMPETERAVIILAYRDELSQSEIAARLGWPIGTVKTRTRRALLKLRDVLGREEGMEYATAAVAVEVGE